MDRSVAFYLVADTYTQDSIGQHIPTQAERLVYGRVSSVSRAEWSAAGELGIKPELTLTMFGPDYAGEKTVRIDGKTYGVYRTYQRTNDDLELYLEWKTGDSNYVEPEPEPTPGGEDNGADADS